VILFPAVDIQASRAVRLRQGRFDEQTVYADTPLAAARAWAEAGARYLHVVDLDGARIGAPQHLGELRRIVEELDVPVQFGGGLRTYEAVRVALDTGPARIVLGTAALRDPDLLDAALGLGGPERVVVGVDARDGHVAVAGWTEETELRPAEVVARLDDRGVHIFVYTNVARDGTLEGPDLDGVRAICAATEGSVIASGGVASLGDLEALRDLGVPNLEGVIVGKALYERRFAVAEGNAVLDAAGGGARAAPAPGGSAAPG
jgi:phosphoribosylformimino-5-aminoimidazole carboxamide ribotide isomerase